MTEGLSLATLCSGGGRTQSREEAGVESGLLRPDPVLLLTGCEVRIRRFFPTLSSRLFTC